MNIGNIASSIAKIVVLPTDSSGNLLAQKALIMISVAMFSILVFSIVATLIGFPSSESNELVGGLTGASVAYVAMDLVQSIITLVNNKDWLLFSIELVSVQFDGGLYFLGWFLSKDDFE